MAFARSVDNFVTYLKELLEEVISKHPNILKSDENNETWKFILSFDSISDLKNAIAEKKIEQLYFKGIESIVNFFKNNLGIDLFNDSENESDFNLFVKSRNLIVHNRGKVNTSYKKIFPSSPRKIGESLSFGYIDISILNVQLNNWIAEIDEKVADKFKLKRIKNFA